MPRPHGHTLLPLNTALASSCSVCDGSSCAIFIGVRVDPGRVSWQPEDQAHQPEVKLSTSHNRDDCPRCVPRQQPRGINLPDLRMAYTLSDVLTV